MNTVVKLKESLTSEYDFKVTKTRNFLKLVKEDFDTYTIYVKESNLHDGFWGLNENQIINLKSQNKRWGVVLLIREFDKDNLSLRFHTDSRSTKLFEISSNKNISLLGYDSKNKLQIRISGEAEIIKIDKILKGIWGKSLDFNE